MQVRVVSLLSSAMAMRDLGESYITQIMWSASLPTPLMSVKGQGVREQSVSILSTWTMLVKRQKRKTDKMQTDHNYIWMCCSL